MKRNKINQKKNGSFLAACACFLVVIAGCSAPKTLSYPNPVQQEEISWEKVFQQAGKIDLTQLITGEVLPNRKDLLNLSNAESDKYPTEDVWLKNVTLLLRHENKGDFLINTGYDASYATSAHGKIGGLMANRTWKARQNPGNDLASLLKDHQAKPHTIFLENWNPDHIASIPDLSKDITYISGAGERYLNVPLLFHAPFLKGLSPIKQIDFSTAKKVDQLGPVIDVLGDQSIWAISAPGFTKGQLAFLIASKQGPVLYTGEAITTKFQFEHGVEAGRVTDREQAVESLQMLRNFVRKYPQVKVIYGKEI